VGHMSNKIVILVVHARVEITIVSLGCVKKILTICFFVCLFDE